MLMHKFDIFTRSHNDILFSNLCKTTKYACNQIKKFDTREGAYAYLIYIMETSSAEWVVNVDEDAIFIKDSIEIIIKYLEDNNYDYCGVPDGGTHIRGQNAVVTNPFFNIFKRSKIIEAYNSSDKEKIFYYQCTDKMFNSVPERVISKNKKFTNHKYDMTNYKNAELFYGYFLWLADNFKCYYMNWGIHPDLYSTIVYDSNNEHFLTHSWYAREYGKDAFHTNRINSTLNIIKDKPPEEGLSFIW